MATLEAVRALNFAQPDDALVEYINRLADARGPEAATGLLAA
jgi:hypothetical protein